MPSPRVPEGNLFDASFETGDIISTPQTSSDPTDLFDPFGDVTPTPTTSNKSQSSSMDFLNTLDSQNDFFSNGGSSTNMFQSPTTTTSNNFFDSATPVYKQHQTNGLSTANNTTSSTNLPYEYHDFDAFGNSPTLADFGPKVDPFADTPDWESVASVASEETGGLGNGTTGSSQNPFSIGSEQMTTNQNMDLFNTKNKSPVAIDPFENTDPFANGDDPFSTTTPNHNSDFFGSTNLNVDPFGSANQNPVDPFGSANQNSDPFGSSNSNSDMFGSANQQSTDIFSSNNTTTSNLDIFNNAAPQPPSTNQNLFSAESSLDPFGTTPTNEVLPTSNPFFSSNEPQHHTTQDSGPDMFSDYLTKVASKDIISSGQAVTNTNSQTSNFLNSNSSSDFSLSEDFSEMSMTSEGPKTVVSLF